MAKSRFPLARLNYSYSNLLTCIWRLFLGSKAECRMQQQKEPGCESRPSPYLYRQPLVLLHLLEPRINVIHVAPELIPVWHDTNSLLLFVYLVTGLQPATWQVKQRLVDMIPPCPLPVSKKFALFQQVLHAWLKVVDLTLCNLKKDRKCRSAKRAKA